MSKNDSHSLDVILRKAPAEGGGSTEVGVADKKERSDSFSIPEEFSGDISNPSSPARE